MKSRASFIAVIFLVCFAGSNALQDDSQDFFLAPSCGGSPSTPPPVRVNMETLQRHRISGALPVYPEAGKTEQLAGVVAMDLQVDTSGAVAQIKVLSGDPVLSRAAVQAVTKWKYRPVTVGGSAIAVNGNVLLTFNPAKSPPVREGGEWPLRRLGCSGPQGPLLYQVNPNYPKMARAAHLEGDVVLDIVIDKEGNVADMKVVSGHPLLVQSAMDAVKQWRYQPYLVAGQPVAVDGRVTVKFHM
jgi:TonB family protein